MKKIIISTILIVIIGLGIMIYPYFRLAAEIKSIVNKNGTYEMNWYTCAEGNSEFELDTEIKGNKQDGKISGIIGEEDLDSFVLDMQNKTLCLNVGKLCSMWLEGKNVNVTDSKIAGSITGYLDGIYISWEQLVEILANEGAETEQLESVMDVFVDSILMGDFPCEKVKIPYEFRLENQYLFKVTEDIDTMDIYIAVDRIGNSENSMTIISKIPEGIIKSEINFTKDDTAEVSIPETYVSETVIDVIAYIYQILRSIT